MKKVLLSLCLVVTVVFGASFAAVAEDVLTIGIYQEPETLNTYIGVQNRDHLCSQTLCRISD